MAKEMIKPGFLALVAIAMLLAVTAACGGDDPTAVPTATTAAGVPTATMAVPTPTVRPTATQPPAAMVPVVNRLMVAVTTDRETSDPTQIGGTQSAQYMPMYEALVRYDKNGASEPMLAESWTASSDMKTWTFDLREGVRFHGDFGEFSAKDVVHTIQQQAREGSQSNNAKFYQTEILPDLEVENDDSRIIFNMTTPKVDMDWHQNNRNNNLILSKAHFDAQGEDGVENSPIGTAPYQYVERKLGSYILFERVPYEHWRVTPDFPELQIFFVKESSTKLAMLLAGEIHLVELPPDLERTAVANGMKVISSTVPMLNVYSTFGGNFYTERVGRRATGEEQPDLPFSNIYHPVTEVPWVHIKVREALNRAINRKELQATIFGGKGEFLMVNPFHPTLPGWNPEWPEKFEEKYGYDPEKARQLLKEVEEEIGQPLDWSKVVLIDPSTAAAPHIRDAAQAVVNYWKAIGVPIKTVTMELAAQSPHVRAGSLGGVSRLEGARRWEEPNMLWIFHYSGRTLANACCHFFENDLIDTAYENLVGETDLAKRDQLVRDAGNAAFDLYANLPLIAQPLDFTIDPDVVADHISSGIWGVRDLEYAVAVKK